MAKSSLEYAELQGLQLYLTYLKTRNSTNTDSNLSIVVKAIEDRISQLQKI